MNNQEIGNLGSQQIADSISNGNTYNLFVLSGVTNISGELPLEQMEQVIQNVKHVVREDDPRIPSFTVRSGSEPPPPFMAPTPRSQGYVHQPVIPSWQTQLQNMAQAHGDPWLPQQTAGLYGIDLTGLWIPFVGPGVPSPDSQSIIRQFGPYLNIVISHYGQPNLYAEGILNPINWFIRFTGQAVDGETVDIRVQLYPDWSLQGQQFNLWEEKNPIKRLLNYPLKISERLVHLRKVA